MRVFLGLLFLIIVGCNQRPKESVKLNKVTKVQPENLKEPRIYKINEDSLKTYTSGTEQFPTVQIKKADHSNKVLLRGPRPIMPGRSFLPQTKEDIILGKKPIKSKPPKITKIEGKPTINTPGTGVFEKPLTIEIANPVLINLDSVKDFKKRIIENNKYTIQNGDTTLPPLRVMAKHLPSSPAKTPGTKDNSVLDARYLDMKHGLSQSQVSSVIETIDGVIWMSYRGNGLSTYNGNSFTHFGSLQGLNDGQVNKLIKDRNGNIWIATNNNGVSKYDGRYFTWYTTDQGLPDNEVHALLERSNGDIIFGTPYGISIFNGKELINYNEKQGFPAESLRHLWEDTKKNIWISAGKLTKFDGNKFHVYTQKPILDAGHILSVLEDKKGNIWFGTLDSGIYLMQGKSLFNFATPQGSTNSSITAIFEDKRENIWFATYGEGIFKFDGESFTNYNTEHGLRNNTVFSITEDSGGKLWLSANGDGVSIFDPNSFTHFTTEQGLKNNWATKIIEDENKNLWFASWGSGLYKFDGEFYTNFTKKEGLLYDWVGEIITDQDKNIWAPTEYGAGGLSMFDQEKFTNYLIHEKIPDIRFTCSEPGVNGDLWFGTLRDGLLKYSNKSGLVQFTHFDQSFLKNRFIFELYLDKNENLWIGTYGDGLYIFNGRDFINFNTDNGLAGNKITSFSEDESGIMRIGTANGLSLYDGSSFKNITVKDGLAHNFIRNVVDDRNGNHWVSTTGGLSLLSKDYSKLYNFALEDGLKGMDFKSHSGLLDSKNRLWWGTGKAVTMLDLNAFKLSKSKPKIKINEILINQKHYDYRQIEEWTKDSLEINYTEVPAFYNIPKDLNLNHKNNTLTFQYAGIDWQGPHQLKYQYKLEGVDESWSALTKEHEVVYRNLSHGTFTFKVKAIGAAQIWSKPFEYTFNLEPPWWHTWWARTIYALLFLLLIILIVQWRTQYILEREKILKLSEEKFRTLVTNTEEIIYMIDKDGTFLLSEGKGLSKLGLEGGDVVGKSVFDIYKEFPEMLEKMRQAFDGETVIIENEVENNYFRSWYTPHLDKNGEIVGLLGLSINITEQKQSQLRILEYQKHLQELSSEITLSEEKLRKQIAIDLHDDVGQSLASSRIELSTLVDRTDELELSTKLNSISRTLLGAIQATRNAIFNLSPPELNEIGLFAAIIDWLKEQVEKKHNIITQISSNEDKYPLEESTRILVYRSIKELAMNTVKHAKATMLKVDLKQNKEMLEVSIEDNGVGFDYELTKTNRKGYGLFSVQERVSDMGGAMTIDSKPGGGTKINIKVPLKGKEK